MCIILADLAQEIGYIGTYSNAFGGDWFSQILQNPITSSDLVAKPDSKLVLVIKFILSKLTVIQLIMMRAQFKLMTSIMIEQKQLDVNMLAMDPDKYDQPPQVLTLTGSLGYSSSSFLLFKFCLEFAICAIHPPPFVKKRFVTTIIGRDAIYNIDSLVPAPLPA